MDGEDRSIEALSAAKAGAAPARVAPAAPASGGPRALAKIAVVLLLLGAGVTYLLTSSQDVFVYSHTVAEVMADPSAFSGRTLRAEGDLVDGTVRFHEDPCDYQFTLSGTVPAGAGSSGPPVVRTMPVDFPQCVVPDTFREGMGITVVVEGRLGDDGIFHASQVIPRCPSRYEMDQRAGRGETMPHALPAAPSPTPR
ncbi:MAG: cytochrome c maturation protein CcmE [Sandaracinus sp.]